MERKRGPISKMPEKEKFQKLYYDKSITIEELASMYHVKPQTVYNWAHKFKKQEVNGVQ